MHYPWYSDKSFTKKLLSKKEFLDNNLSIDEDKSCIKKYQYIVGNFINPKSPYTSILLHMSTGTGKTLAAITIAENFIRKNSNSKIIVMTKGSDLDLNFQSELINVCSSYTTDEEKDIFSKGALDEKSELMKKLTTRIKHNYKFIHHETFKKQAETISFSNNIIIIDEFHHLLGENGYYSLMSVLKKSRNYRLILLSATPIFDKIEVAFKINNILAGKEQFPINIAGLINMKYLSSADVENISIFNDGGIYNLTRAGTSVLVHSLIGKIFYLKQDVVNFPSSNDIGDYIKIGGYTSSTRLVHCKMSIFQEERYMKVFEIVENNSQDFNRTMESVSSIVYPDSGGMTFIGASGYDKYIENGTKKFLKKDNIHQYSTKLYNLLLNLENSHGKVFIFSNHVTKSGINLIRNCLEQNGHTSYIMLSSYEQNAARRKELIDRFNHANNINGDKIKIIIASSVVAEGITLKEIRQVHIYEPSWNLSSIDQIIGRAIRNGSHSRLPKKDRTVDIFRYIAIPKDIRISSDASKYIKADRKDIFIKKFEREISKSSFSCFLTKKRNMNTTFKDYSRDCDYNECKYDCNVEYTPDDIDISTYDMFSHNKELFSRNEPLIKGLFKKIPIWTVDDISKKIPLHKNEISSIMKKIVSENPIKILSRGKYFMTVDYFQSLINHPSLKDKNIEDFYFKRNKIDKIKILKGVDGTIRIKNKTCLSFNKNELIEIFKSQGLDKPSSKLKKNELCEKLFKDLGKASTSKVKSSKVKSSKASKTDKGKGIANLNTSVRSFKSVASMSKVKSKTSNGKATKDCPEGKVINPKTGRCIKICPEGKVRNPATGGCINILKGSKVRNPAKESKLSVASVSKAKSPVKSPKTSTSKAKSPVKSPKASTSKAKSPVKSPKASTSKVKLVGNRIKIFLNVKSKNGKFCTGFDKGEILSFFTKLGLSRPSEKLTKEQLCTLLHKQVNI